MKMKRKSYILLIAHGTRGNTGTQAFWSFVKALQRVLPGRRVEGCFLELADPKLSDQLERCYREGGRSFFILPLLLFPGRHAMEDIPRELADFKMKHSDADFHYAPPLGSDPALIRLLAAKAKAVEDSKAPSKHPWKRKDDERSKRK